MTENNPKLVQTMRIDLIPDVPVEPLSGKKKKIVISTPTRRHKPVKSAKTEEIGTGEVIDSGYRTLLQNVYDAVLITDLSCKVVDANVRAKEFFQYETDDICQLTIYDIIAGADEKLLENIWQNLENERFTVIEAYCVRRDGSYFPSEIAFNRLKLDEWHLCLFMRDITIRRQEQNMLRAEHNAIQNAGNGIAIAGLDASLEYANPALAKMWGVDAHEDLEGRSIMDLLSNEQTIDEMLKAVLERNESWIAETTFKRADGIMIDVQVSAAGNRNRDGELVGIVFSFVDIGDRKRAEEAEMEAERRRVMLESLGAACHHLGQPATVLLANLGILQKKLGSIEDPVVRDLLNGSINAMEGLGEILHKLNTVNEYKTTQYLEKGDSNDQESRILQI